MKNILVLPNRTIALDMLMSGSRLLCRFPRRNGRGSYFDIQAFESMVAIDSIGFSEDDFAEISPSTTRCIVTFENVPEFDDIEFDCTPDELVDILRMYRQTIAFASFVAGIPGR